MFNGIARRYDFLNHLLSLNLDRSWRRRAVETLGPSAGSILIDLCGGTGDLTVGLARSEGRPFVICCDFAHGMLERAAEKIRRERLPDRCVVLEADGLNLPLPDESIDGVAVAFGVRNFHDLDCGLSEIRRVLRPGGVLVILEFSTPTAPVLSSLYRFYLSRVLPKVGDSVSGRDGPYGYLARTIGGFPDQSTLATRIRDRGFSDCTWKNLTGGIVALHRATK